MSLFDVGLIVAAWFLGQPQPTRIFHTRADYRAWRRWNRSVNGKENWKGKPARKYTPKKGRQMGSLGFL